MKKIAVLSILFIFAQIIVGCQGQTPNRLSGLLDDNTNLPVAAVSSSSADNSAINTSSPFSAGTTPPVNFYPDAGLPAASSDTEIVLTDKLKMKLYLVEKYKPGICFGMPAINENEDIASTLKNNAPMAQFVRQYYKMDSDLEIYTKIRQIDGIRLIRGQNGKYIYGFTDGQCCDLIIYSGEINVINSSIFETLLQHNAQKMPC